MDVSFTCAISLHSLHQLVRPCASVEQVHVFLAGTSSSPACVATSSLLQLRFCHFQSEFCTSWCFNSLSPPPNSVLSTAKLPHTAHKCLWMLTTLSFSWTKNSITAARCLKRESATDASLKIQYSSAICWNDSKLGMRAGETSYFKPSELHLSIFVNGWEKCGANLFEQPS
jgi:hypothetical protein